MNRKLFALLAILALSITVGGMACVDTLNSLDEADETDTAT